jgi:cation:H+ antiporter
LSHVLLLLVCAVVIYLSCEWFVNAVEWLGHQLSLAPVAVGTVLAALGTALPESVVTLVAVTFGGGRHGKDIGVGAALGGPLVVGTIAYATVGATLLLRRRVLGRRVLGRRVLGRRGVRRAVADPARVPPTDPSSIGTAVGAAADPLAAATPDPAAIVGVDTRRLARDQAWFLAIFVVKVGLGLVAFAVKPWLGLVFFLVYGIYFWREIRVEVPGAEPDLEPLKLQPGRVVPSRAAVLIQTLVTLGLIFAASQLFVLQLEWAGPALGLPPMVVALLLSPIATELPETMNALIWVRQGKTQLALANISGAMMIQATIPSGLGLLFTPWRFDGALILAGGVTLLAVGYLLVLLRTARLTAARLAATALFYSAFAVALAFVV